MHVVGSPGLDHLRRRPLLDRAALEAALGAPLGARNLLVTFHPVTLEPGAGVAQFDELLHALDGLGAETTIWFTRPNADTGRRAIAARLDAWAALHADRVHVFASLGQLRYLSLMAQVDAVVGNSSSGLYEAPSLGVPSVDIGERQRGRLAAASVLHCEPQRDAISAAIGRASRLGRTAVENPYGDGDSARRIVDVLRRLPPRRRPCCRRPSTGPGRRHMAERTLVIAEAGVNHNGSLDLALRLVDVAADAGADVVKFQTFKAEQLATAAAAKAGYQVTNTGASGSQLEMLRRLELAPRDHEALLGRCRERGIRFMSTAFDAESLAFLATLAMPAIKIPSGDVTCGPLLLQAARLRQPLILSTGMATLAEIEAALGVLAWGLTRDDEPTGSADLEAAFAGAAGQRALQEHVTLLHCVTQYPARCPWGTPRPSMASSSLCSVTRSANRCSRAPRSAMPIRGHGPSSKALRADATARSASSAPPSATSAYCVCVHGSTEPKRAPEADSISRPWITWAMSSMASPYDPFSGRRSRRDPAPGRAAAPRR